ncbi:MAG: DUF420 domain-containing protein [Planctomycetaceae bacterium]|nr:DUF420 domain-containing protein [Planctomycetaceae bacterium]
MYPGLDGPLGTRGSLMLDVVFVAMFAVLPVLAWSIWLVRVRRNYAWHKRVQLALAAVLGLTVLIFEVDIRLHGWRERAAPSPYYPSLMDAERWSESLGGRLTGLAQAPGWVDLSLALHLIFAVSTAVLWTVVVVRAVRRFPHPPEPAEHSASHRFWGWVAAIDLLLTSLTGWLFYYLAFVA